MRRLPSSGQWEAASAGSEQGGQGLCSSGRSTCVNDKPLTDLITIGPLLFCFRFSFCQPCQPPWRHCYHQLSTGIFPLVIANLFPSSELAFHVGHSLFFCKCCNHFLALQPAHPWSPFPAAVFNWRAQVTPKIPLIITSAEMPRLHYTTLRITGNGRPGSRIKPARSCPWPLMAGWEMGGYLAV